MTRIHHAVSIIFSAPMIAAYVTIAFSLFYPAGMSSGNVWKSIVTGLFFLSLIPAATIFANANKLIDLNFFERKKRNSVYPLVIISYFLGAFTFWYTGNKIMFLISISYMFVTLSLFIINLSWKVSVHTAGITGPVTALICVFGSFLSPLYLLTIPVAYSRYKLGSHDNRQLVAGALIAIIVTYLTYSMLW